MRSDDLSERVRVLLAPALEPSGLELFDVELTGLRGPNAQAGLRGPNAQTGLRGPNAQAGLRGPNAYGGGTLRVTVDREGGVDLDAISRASQVVSSVLDQHDDLIPGRYLLEVSSPGIERPLRRPEHFRRAVGSTVAVKTRPEVEGDRRVEGVLESADEHGVVVSGRALSYEEIERARTLFVWPQSRKAGAPR